MNRRRSEAFLLRIVMDEQQEVQIDEWMGRVQHVPSGKELRFTGVQELLAFVNAIRTERIIVAKNGKK